MILVTNHFLSKNSGASSFYGRKLIILKKVNTFPDKDFFLVISQIKLHKSN